MFVYVSGWKASNVLADGKEHILPDVLVSWSSSSGGTLANTLAM